MKKLLLLTLATLPLFAAAQVPSYVPTNGLVGWWPFNGNANDESGNGNNGTVNGATLTTDRNGNVNTAFQFQNFTDHIRIVDQPDLDLTASFSISGWYLPTDLSPTITPYRSILSKASNNNSSIGGYVMGITSFTNPTKFDFQGGSPYVSNVQASGISNFVLSQWRFVVVSYDQATNHLKYYDNSVLTDSHTVNFNLQNTSLDLFFGNHFNGNNPNGPNISPWNGSLDDIGIWNRALTPCEIQALYNSGNSGLTLTTSATNLCVSDGSASLLALPSGGTWSGTGVSGNAFNPAISGAGTFYPVYTVTNASGCVVSDSVAITVDVCTGITQEYNSSFTVFPNPATNNITVTWKNAEVKTLTLRDASGRAARTYNVSGTQAQLSLEGLASGVYFLRDETGFARAHKIIVD
jgi:hypothetical protein